MTNFNLEEFDYKLPKELIAQYPRESRDQSNLLVYTKEGTILHQKFYEIANFIPKGSLLLRNVSKVIPARFLLQKQTGGKVEILLLEPISPSPDPQVALASTGSTTWKALLRGRNIKAGTILVNDCSFDFELTAKVLDKNNEYSILEFNSKNFGSTFSEILEKLGRIPLPPYISRNDEEIDKIRYQTIYGYKPGSVASPTAGLHFSEPIIANFNTRSINFVEITLHIGLGTFKPIQSENIYEHKMHSEKLSVDFENLEKIYNFLTTRDDFQYFIAVGTTSVRTMESIFWLAQLLYSTRNEKMWDSFEVDQYIWREIEPKLDKLQTVEFLLEEMSKRKIKKLEGSTSLYITPDYKIRFFDAIITNFHQPRSTLLLLVYSFVGEDWKRIYREAIEKKYRFLSYGDSSLLFKTMH